MEDVDHSPVENEVIDSRQEDEVGHDTVPVTSDDNLMEIAPDPSTEYVEPQEENYSENNLNYDDDRHNSEEQQLNNSHDRHQQYVTYSPEEILKVRFTFRPYGFYFENYFSSNINTSEIKRKLEVLFRCPSGYQGILWSGRLLRDEESIGHVCILPDNGLPLMLDVELNPTPRHLLELSDGDQIMFTTVVEAPTTMDSKMASEIIDNGINYSYVTVVRGYDRKPFLGGFRHKKTESIFHHATTQCQFDPQVDGQVRDYSYKISRSTQTQGVTRSCQTTRECGTQMSRVDILIDETYDRVVYAKPYFSADKLHALQVQKTIYIQALVRGWRARRIAKKLRQERDEEELYLELEYMHRKEEHTKKKMEEIDRRTHPRSAEDFAILHNELEAWRLQEVKRIEEANLLPEERRIAMMELLKKETKLLHTIDRLQLQASKENRTRRINHTLNKMSSAKIWGDENTFNVVTPLVVRAKELKDLYNGLDRTKISIDERLDLLLNVKWTVKEFDCKLTREIVELIDREADLLNRRRKESTLVGLRLRIRNLFLQFIETPEFNPEAFQFQRVPLEYAYRPLVKLTKK
eukprot:Tbor_TRINITY_DN5853_c1_g7::TRINITY_DN5853_c1_g7_i1::g.7039::m.7039